MIVQMFDFTAFNQGIQIPRKFLFLTRCIKTLLDDNSYRFH